MKKYLSPWFSGLLIGLTLTGTLHADSLKSSYGDRPWDVPHSIYKGSYGNTQGIFAIQWMGTKVRGSFIQGDQQKELRLYGDNSQQGRVIMEVWDKDRQIGSLPLVKLKRQDGLSWVGTMHVTELLSIPIAMHKYKPSGKESLSSSSSYSGTLGKTRIRVHLDWYKNGRVLGRYSNLNTGQSYDLEGYNYAQGKVYLSEWDGNNSDVEGRAISARIGLKKQTINGKLRWTGRMFNMDGRIFDMSFSRGTQATNASTNTKKKEDDDKSLELKLLE
ncbi:hypothetical protein HW115_01290 [Verrucomicrobiaceae bacterium N1E253]|uniref:Uncharacterized protein n=1 Tax=Oceaniferula marina TaxID=2748318 RepID=A0A851G933_9BACT|nr:hypothetical protein [Oceaniferula marina]NWK54228.1 hypothetical protein [Oceaniferula marina]